MSETVTVHGQSLKNQRTRERENDLHFLSVHAAAGATPQRPRWVILHHGADGTEPREFVFENGRDLLSHIVEHAMPVSPRTRMVLLTRSTARFCLRRYRIVMDGGGRRGRYLRQSTARRGSWRQGHSTQASPILTMSEQDKPTAEQQLLAAKQAEMKLRWRKPVSEGKRQRMLRKRANKIMDEVGAQVEKLKAAKPRGGPRPGAGRKPDYFKKLGIKPISAHELLQALDIPKIIGDLINDRNPQIRLATLTMLLNRAYGLPKETGELNVTGLPSLPAIQVAFVTAKDGQLVPLPEQGGKQLIEGVTSEVTPPNPAPVAEFQPPPPPPEPTGNCRFHGDFRLSESGGREICPQSKHDADLQEKWLAGLLPAGGRQ